MPIGPMGEPLPYNNGAPVGNPMGANPEALTQRLMEIAQEAEMIIGQLESMGVNPEQLLAGGGQNAPPATPMPEMPQMPVEGNTGGMGGLLAGGPQYA